MYCKTGDGSVYEDDDGLEKLVLRAIKLIEDAGLGQDGEEPKDEEVEKVWQPLYPVTVNLEWKRPNLGSNVTALTDTSVQKLKETFEQWDEDKSGAISKAELSKVLLTLN